MHIVLNNSPIYFTACKNTSNSRYAILSKSQTITFTGVPHFAESYYVFGTPLWDEDAPCPWVCRNVVWYSKQEWSEVDKQVARDIMEAWTNFAKTGCVVLQYHYAFLYASIKEHIFLSVYKAKEKCVMRS